MRQIFTISCFLAVSFALLSSISYSDINKKDALDHIGIYHNDSLIGSWREFDSAIEVDFNVPSFEDTLFFYCFTDVGWMDSTSLRLSTELERRSSLKLKHFIQPETLRTHYELPLSTIDQDIETIEVWRATSLDRSAIIFHIHLIK